MGRAGERVRPTRCIQEEFQLVLGPLKVGRLEAWRTHQMGAIAIGLIIIMCLNILISIVTDNYDNAQ